MNIENNMVREDTVHDTRQKVLETLANHFGPTGSKDILISTLDPA